VAHCDQQLISDGEGVGSPQATGDHHSLDHVAGDGDDGTAPEGDRHGSGAVTLPTDRATATRPFRWAPETGTRHPEVAGRFVETASQSSEPDQCQLRAEGTATSAGTRAFPPCRRAVHVGSNSATRGAASLRRQGITPPAMLLPVLSSCTGSVTLKQEGHAPRSTHRLPGSAALRAPSPSTGGLPPILEAGSARSMPTGSGGGSPHRVGENHCGGAAHDRSVDTPQAEPGSATGHR
jgi:hypothetical protein